MNVQTLEFTKSNEHLDFKLHKKCLDVKPQKELSDFKLQISQKEGLELKPPTSSNLLPLTLHTSNLRQKASHFKSLTSNL
jgi:hypothetical protein